MRIEVLLVIIGAILVAYCYYFRYHPLSFENYSTAGYGTITSIAMRNQSKHCWRDQYDGATYCSIIGPVIL